MTPKERPILFSGEMIRAILDGRKTVTRRVVSRINGFGQITEFQKSLIPGYDWLFRNIRKLWNEINHKRLMDNCPYGQPGDRLWVRETFVLESNCGDFPEHEPPFNDGRPVKWDTDHEPEDGNGMWLQAHYAATDPTPELVNEDCPFEKCSDDGCCQHWKPSIHMPRWASRITLEVTGVRVERLMPIKTEDVRAEGVACFVDFEKLWNDTYAKRGFGWDKNPWVWVVEFRKVTP